MKIAQFAERLGGEIMGMGSFNHDASTQNTVLRILAQFTTIG